MLVTRALPATIDFLDLHRLAPARYPALFESSAHGTAQGRWDLLLAGFTIASFAGHHAFLKHLMLWELQQNHRSPRINHE